MNIKFLGTGAAEGIPAIFCNCSVCKYARKSKGRNIRTRSQALIDNNLLLDFGPDTYWHEVTYGLNLAEIKHCLISHTHSDHLYVEDIKNRRKSRANLPEDSHPLCIYGGEGVKDLLLKDNEKHVTKDARVLFFELTPYCTTTIDNYFITPLPAVHKTETPFVYVIQKNEKTLLYGHDTDIFDEQVFDFIRKKNFRFNCVSLDCTEGRKQISYRGHMNFERILTMLEHLRSCGAVGEFTKKIANHFSHNGLVNYDDALVWGQENGIEIAYDGMEVTI